MANRKNIFKRSIVRYYVCLPECNHHLSNKNTTRNDWMNNKSWKQNMGLRHPFFGKSDEIGITGQISIVPKPELRGFWGGSPAKPAILDDQPAVTGRQNVHKRYSS